LREFKTGEFLGFMDAAETYLVYSKREVDLPVLHHMVSRWSSAIGSRPSKPGGGFTL